MDADDVRVKQAAERIRELSGDVADVLSGGLSFDTFTYRGSLLHDLLDAALVLQKHYLADAGRAADKTACEACGGRGFTSVATGWCDSCEGTGYAGRAADGEPGVADGATFAERYGVGQAKDHYDTSDLITAFEAGKACQRRAAGGEAGRKPADWRWEAWTVHTTICKERVGTDGDVRFCALALAGEVGELCNLIKKQWRAEWGYPPEDPGRLRREIADEIADSMVYLFLLAKTLGFDLDHITADKWGRVRPRYGPEVQAALGGGAGRGTT